MDESRTDHSQSTSPLIMASPTSKPTFLSLPPEIRGMIYEYVYSGPSILLTCKEGDINTWSTSKNKLITIAPFRKFRPFGTLPSFTHTRASINTSFGLLTTCRTTYSESIGLVARLTEVHLDDFTTQATFADYYMPVAWMRLVRHLNLSASLTIYELLQMKRWYPELAVLELSDCSLHHAVLVPRSRLLDLSHNGVLSLFGGDQNEVEHWVLGGTSNKDRELYGSGTAVFEALAGVELRFSRLICRPRPEPKVYYEISINSKNMVARFDYYDAPDKPADYMSKEEFERGGHGLPPRKITI